MSWDWTDLKSVCVSNTIFQPALRDSSQKERWHLDVIQDIWMKPSWWSSGCGFHECTFPTLIHLQHLVYKYKPWIMKGDRQWNASVHIIVIWRTERSSESQNCRMGQAGRDLSGSSNPTSQLKQSHPRAQGSGLSSIWFSNPALAFVSLHSVPLCPSLQPAEVLLKGCAALWAVGHWSQHRVTSDLAEEASTPSPKSFMNKLNLILGPS